MAQPLAHSRNNNPTAFGAADVTVVGLGFVGLPLALSYARAGLRVIGADVNPNLVSDLNTGSTHLLEECEGDPIGDVLKKNIAEGRFQATCDVGLAIRSTRNVIITVGMPVTDGQVVERPLVDALTTVSANLQSGTLVLLRSTVVPGTTEGLALPLLEEGGRKVGVDFFLAYAPERIAEGKAFEEFANMPTLVAGVDIASTERAVGLLERIVRERLVVVEQVRAAELSKVIENVQRDVNIAMVQVFARVCEAMGLNSAEVVGLANTHKRVKLLSPGPGVGGFCLPNAVHYLAPAAEQLGVDISLLKLARRINEGVPNLVANKVSEILSSRGKTRGVKVAVVGLAMKDFCSDARLSPPLVVCELLRSEGFEVCAYDPCVQRQVSYHVSSLDECLAGADVLVLLAKQHGVTLPSARRLAELMAPHPYVVDTRDWFQDPCASECGVSVWKI